MAIATRPRRGFRWNSPWLAGIVTVVAIVVLSIGIGVGMRAFRPGGQPAMPVVTSANPSPAPPATPSMFPSPSTVPTPSPTPSPSPLTSPTPLPAGVAGLNCRIALSYHAGDALVGGWVSFPGGGLEFDPTSNARYPDGSAAASGLTHDLALNRWLPVPREWITPDGLTYVYMTQDRRSIEVVDGNGAAHALGMPIAAGGTDIWHLLGAEAEGVYVDHYPGLLLIGWDGTFHWITNEGYWEAVGGGSAYGQLVPPGEVSNTIVRRDFKSGTTTDVFTKQGSYSFVRGLGTGGAPIIMTEGPSAPTEVWLGDSTPTRLISTSSAFGVWSTLADGHGTWISTNVGLYLYTPSAGVELASNSTGVLASTCR